MPWADCRAALFDRSRGRCERCRADLNVTGMDGHHRLGRRLGPDCLCNLLALCPRCHERVHVEDRANSELNGHIIRRGTLEPAAVPALLAVGWRMLACDGTIAPWTPSD